MGEAEVERSSTTEGLPVAPSLGPALEGARLPTHATPIDPRGILISIVSIFVGILAGLVAQVLIHLIALISNVCFFGRFALNRPDVRLTHIGAWVIVIPVIGGLIIGLMLRYGSRAVAGHGIPEAMEQVLRNDSAIPPKMTFLKPLGAAVSIGTGGPFGVEGPIIATGGALGSLIGQLFSTSAAERKILLSAGAAAGIAAAFACPFAAIFLAIELLLFEFRPRSIIPVVLASVAATAVHIHFEGPQPMFPFTGAPVASPAAAALIGYTLLGCVIGLAAVGMTRTVYAIEHFFEHLSIPWMWHPAIGAIAVGVIGYIDLGTLGPGYFNLNYLLSEKIVLHVAAILCLLKFLSWTISLGSGTSGGTLAPVFTIGGALAAVLAIFVCRALPNLGWDVRVAALMGMVAIFAGASRALLTSILFAFEVTHEPHAILPSILGCTSAYVVSAMLMQHSIMTEKMARQGVRVPADYSVDDLQTTLVTEVMTPDPVTLSGSQRLSEVRQWLGGAHEGNEHQGFPVLDENGFLLGVLTRRSLLDTRLNGDPRIAELIPRPPVVVYSDCTLRDAADHMVNHNIGRLPVIDRQQGAKVIGIVTRADILASHRRRLMEEHQRRRPELLRRGPFRSRI